MTINEKYYAMNAALNIALKAQNVACPVYKYGAVAELKKYPYIQTAYRVIKRQPFGSSTSGILTDFEYILNYFTAAENERSNDAALFYPYEIARELVTSPESFIWKGIANILSHNETPEFAFKGGVEVLRRGLIFDCQTVTTFVSTIHGGNEISIDEVTETISESLNEV